LFNPLAVSVQSDYGNPHRGGRWKRGETAGATHDAAAPDAIQGKILRITRHQQESADPLSANGRYRIR
jgi:hypothetical protein